MLETLKYVFSALMYTVGILLSICGTIIMFMLAIGLIACLLVFIYFVITIIIDEYKEWKRDHGWD